ncbi:hypothetical protein BJY52DRAFT_936414 [Lactarius psammicola]|nr:hypothetical protein BJY52DRAFT_936414 [Lactarius psammicola]
MARPPPFPQPFPPTGNANPMQDAIGTLGQRPVYSAQGSAYPPETYNPPNLLPTPTAPRPHPSTYVQLYQPTQGPVHTHPTFPVPQVQDTRVPTTQQFSPPPIMQRSETTYMHGHLNNTQVTPGPYSSNPPQAPIMSYPPSQHDSGMSGPAYTAPLARRNWVDPQGEGYGVGQGLPPMHDDNVRPKSPPRHPVATVPIEVRYPPCLTCQRSCPEGQRFCSAECANR